MGTRNLGTVGLWVTEAVSGFKIHHGVGNTPWGWKYTMGLELHQGGGGLKYTMVLEMHRTPHAGQEALCTYTSWSAYAAMFGSSRIQRVHRLP